MLIIPIRTSVPLREMGDEFYYNSAGWPAIMSFIFKTLALVGMHTRAICGEYPKIILGLSNFWIQFRLKMQLVFILNTIIFAFEIYISYWAASMIDLYNRHNELSYLELLGAAAAYLLFARVLHEVAFPFTREWFLKRFFMFQFVAHVSQTCIERGVAIGLDRLQPNRQPAILNGAFAAYEMTQMILREFLVGARGILVLGFVLFDYPLLALYAAIWMMIDFIIIIHMDSELRGLQHEADESSFAVWAEVARAVDAEGASKRDASEHELQRLRCEALWKQYIKANGDLGIVKLKYDELLRNNLQQIMEFLCFSLLLYFVDQGEISVGMMLFYFDQVGRAKGPFHVFYNFQQKIMATRPALIRLGEMCGIDFGILAPHPKTALTTRNDTAHSP